MKYNIRSKTNIQDDWVSEAMLHLVQHIVENNFH